MQANYSFSNNRKVIVVAGGVTDGFSALDAVYLFDTQHREWSKGM